MAGSDYVTLDDEGPETTTETQTQTQTQTQTTQPEAPIPEPKVLTGPLPPDFLVLQAPRRVNTVVCVTLHEGNLKKDTSFIKKMSLYCNVWLDTIMERGATDSSCGTNPVWNHPLNFFVKTSKPKRLKVEVYDQGFLSDDLVAIGYTNISQVYESGREEMDIVLNDVDEKGAEVGKIRVTITNKEYRYGQRLDGGEIQDPIPQPQQQSQLTPEQEQANAAALQAQQRAQEEHFAQLKAMFPQFDMEVLQSTYAANHGDMDATLNTLLSYNS